MSSFRKTMATTVPALTVDTITRMAEKFDMNPNYIALSWMEFFLHQFNKVAPLELSDYLKAYLTHLADPKDESLQTAIEAKRELLNIIDLVMSVRNQKVN